MTGIKGVWQIKRYRHIQQYDQKLCWRYELQNTATGVVVMTTTTTSPIPPKDILRKQAERNSKWFMDKYIP